MKLLGSTKSKITKYKNSKNVPHLEITKIVLVHCNIVNNDCQQDSRVLHTFTYKFLQISRNWSMVYRPKQSTIRNRR